MGRGHGTGTERRVQPQSCGAGCTSGAAGAPCCLVALGTCTGVTCARRRVVPAPTGVTCVCTRTRGQCEHPHSRASLHGAISPSHLSSPSSSPLFFRKSATITAVSTATSVHPPRCCAMCLIGSSRQRQADTRAPSMHGGGVTRATRHGCAGNVLHGLGARRQHARTCVQRACKDGHARQAGHPQEAATRTRRCPKTPPPPPRGHPQSWVGAAPTPR